MALVRVLRQGAVSGGLLFTSPALSLASSASRQFPHSRKWPLPQALEAKIYSPSEPSSNASSSRKASLMLCGW